MDRYVIVYDIADNRRRTKIHKLMKNYGLAVQESVFEAQLQPADLLNLQAKLKRLLQLQEDTIHFYPLCARCTAANQRLGNTDPFDNLVTII